MFEAVFFALGKKQSDFEFLFWEFSEPGVCGWRQYCKTSYTVSSSKRKRVYFTIRNGNNTVIISVLFSKPYEALRREELNSSALNSSALNSSEKAGFPTGIC